MIPGRWLLPAAGLLATGDHVARRLLVDAGSRQEREEARGLAHFLEHMAFKGSAHYPPGTLIERLQRPFRVIARAALKPSPARAD